MKSKAIIVSGYFNPLHKGHLELFEKAKTKGDVLWVIVNSDLQRALKGSKAFMDEDERLIILKAIGIVDKALVSIDINSGKPISTLKIDNEKISKPFIHNKNLFVIKDNAIIKLD